MIVFSLTGTKFRNLCRRVYNVDSYDDRLKVIDDSGNTVRLAINDVFKLRDFWEDYIFLEEYEMINEDIVYTDFILSSYDKPVIEETPLGYYSNMEEVQEVK